MSKQARCLFNASTRYLFTVAKFKLDSGEKGVKKQEEREIVNGDRQADIVRAESDFFNSVSLPRDEKNKSKKGVLQA